MLSLSYSLLGILFLVLAVLAASHALLNKRDSKAALGWVACCLLVPYLGPFLYLIFGINRTRVSARKMRPVPDDEGVVIRDLPMPAHATFPLAVIGRNVTRKSLLPSEEVEVLENGDQTYPAMLSAMRAARETIYLSTYIFAPGHIAGQFITAMREAMQRGVAVKVLLDGLGEYMSFPRIGRILKKHGIPFRRFNEFTLLPISLHLNLRNHRKLLIVDSKVAFTGGINIADANTRISDSRDRIIQDLHFKLSGNIAADLEYAFIKDWNYCCGRDEKITPGPGPGPMISAGADPPWTRLVLDGPNEDLDKLSDILVGTMCAAERRIWIVTPYFLPDAEIVGVLQAARLRNLEVRVVLPSANNIPPAHWATRNMLWQLLNYGVEIYHQPPPFSHAKVILIDDYYSLVGSANIDPRSLRLNFESGVEVFSRQLNARLEDYVKARMAGAERCSSRALARRSTLVKLRDAAAWLFTPYL